MSNVTSYLDLNKNCAALVDGVHTQYGYRPSLAAGITFVSLFSIVTIAHVGQSTWTRTWWAYVFALGALTEVIGWVGRLWSAVCPYNDSAFLMQISTLIIAPTFFTAGIYIILGRLISLQGPHTSPITPKWYLWIFCTCDIVSLVIQAVGGGLASEASSTRGGDTKPGTDVMVAGILFQMASIAVFTGLAINFLVKVRKDVFPLRLKALVAGTSVSVVMIFVRSVYRCVELLQGWDGFLITREGYFLALDGALMVVAGGVFTFVNPGWLLPNLKGKGEGEMQLESLSDRGLKNSIDGDE
ncbi:MAG: hypothetical protein M1836_006050 [Candelina mexicana]|nr:MAG: hypothetical protein M1836_006050 [Candelina mexicana]